MSEQTENTFPKTAEEAVRVHAKPVNSTGLYEVTVSCGEQVFSRREYLENDHLRQQFIEAALPTATGPLDTPEDARKVLTERLDGEEPLALSGLAKIAREFDLALLVLDYPKPAPGRSRNMRSQTITHSAARTVWAVVRNGQQHSQRLFLPLKNSLGRDGTALAFRITTCDKYDTARIDWQPDPLAVTGARREVAPDLPRLKSNRTTQRELACVWLRKQLLAGARLSHELLTAARAEQISEKPLRQALHQLGGTTRKGPGGRWFWTLPVNQLERDRGPHCEATSNGEPSTPKKCANHNFNFKNAANMTKLTNMTNMESGEREHHSRLESETHHGIQQPRVSNLGRTNRRCRDGQLCVGGRDT